MKLIFLVLLSLSVFSCTTLNRSPNEQGYNNDKNLDYKLPNRVQ